MEIAPTGLTDILHRSGKVGVVLVHADEPTRKAISGKLQHSGIPVVTCSSPLDAQRCIRKDTGVLVLEYKPDGAAEVALLRFVRDLDRELPVVALGDPAYPRTDPWNALNQPGIVELVDGSNWDPALLEAIRRARTTRAEILLGRHYGDANPASVVAEIIGTSEQANDLRNSVQRLARTFRHVLVVGAEGTGKEMVARCIHAASGRPIEEFLKVNAKDFPPERRLQEVWTCARSMNRGTLFFQGIDRLGASEIGQLLRVLGSERFEDIGDPLRVRLIISLEHGHPRDDPALIRKVYEYFRTDMIDVAPLHARQEDVPLLFGVFCREWAERMRCQVPSLQAHEVEQLKKHSWPKNIRELKNVAQRYVTEYARGASLSEILTVAPAGEVPASIPGTQNDQLGAHALAGLPYEYQESSFRREVLHKALTERRGNVSAVAKDLHKSLRCINYWIADCGLTAEYFRDTRPGGSLKRTDAPELLAISER